VSDNPSAPRVHIYADESCLGNQFKSRRNPGGAAGLLEFWTGKEWVRRDYWVSDPDTTNNRMALQSAIQGLGALNQPCEVQFVSDSQYLVRGMKEWIHGWKRKGWKRKGGAIENLELWKELDRVAARHDVEWVWVRGHAGHPQNEYVNDLAVRAARKQENSGGLRPSRFQEWLNQQREEKERYLDFFEFAPPGDRDGA